MSWIRSEQTLQRHPKTLELCRLTGLDLDVVIGRLHLLWYWALDFAFDGDLRKFDAKSIEFVCHLSLKHLQSSNFIDVRPFRRIHDWWQYSGNYLKIKYKNYPEKWMQIEKSYEGIPNNTPNNTPKTMSKDEDVDVRTYGRTDHRDGRTSKSEEARASSTSVPPAPKPKATPSNGQGNGASKPATIVADETQEFGHEDFLAMATIKSSYPESDFEWHHLERALTDRERTMSKLREKQYLARKWN